MLNEYRLKTKKKAIAIFAKMELQFYTNSDRKHFKNNISHVRNSESHFKNSYKTKLFLRVILSMKNYAWDMCVWHRPFCPKTPSAHGKQTAL